MSDERVDDIKDESDGITEEKKRDYSTRFYDQDEKKEENVEKKEPVKKIVYKDFDHGVESTWDLYEEKLTKLDDAPNFLYYGNEFETPLDKQQFYYERFWNPDINANNFDTKPSRQMEGDNVYLGKFDLLNVVMGNNALPTLGPNQISSIDNRFEEDRTKQSIDQYAAKELHFWLQDNAKLDLKDLNLPEDGTRRDKIKKLMYSLDSDQDRIPGIAIGENDTQDDIMHKTLIKDSLSNFLSMQLKATQKAPDISNMSGPAKASLAKNVMAWSLITRTSPKQGNMAGIDLTKLDMKKLNPNGHTVAKDLSSEILRLSDKEITQRFGEALDGTNVQDIRKTLAIANIKTTEERLSPKELQAFRKELPGMMNDIEHGLNIDEKSQKRKKVTQGMLKTAKTASEYGEDLAKGLFISPIKRTFHLYTESKNVENFASDLLINTPAIALEAIADVFDSWSEKLLKESEKTKDIQDKDHTLGRLMKSNIDIDLANKTLDAFYKGYPIENENNRNMNNSLSKEKAIAARRKPNLKKKEGENKTKTPMSFTNRNNEIASKIDETTKEAKTTREKSIANRSKPARQRQLPGEKPRGPQSPIRTRGPVPGQNNKNR